MWGSMPQGEGIPYTENLVRTCHRHACYGPAQMLSFRFGRASASKKFRPAEQVGFQISHVESVMRVFQIR